MTTKKLGALLAAVTLKASAASTFAALTTIAGPFIVPFYTTYGDANVYSLPTLVYVHCAQNVAGFDTAKDLSCKEGTDLYKVVAQPGAIKDLTVIGAGPEGQQI